MNLRFYALIALMLIAAGCATVGKPVAGIDNFDVVNPPPSAIYRGAQPSEAGVETLAAKGVRTVVNLRDDPNEQERSDLERAGIGYVEIKSSPWHVDPEQVRRFLATMRTQPRPIYVHCQQGRDRTGVEIAVYRVVDEKWSREDAIREMREHGYHWLLFSSLEKFVKTFDPEQFGK